MSADLGGVVFLSGLVDRGARGEWTSVASGPRSVVRGQLCVVRRKAESAGGPPRRVNFFRRGDFRRRRGVTKGDVGGSRLLRNYRLALGRHGDRAQLLSW